MACRDKEKQRLASAAHYERNKEAIKARAREFTDKQTVRLKSLILDYLKEHQCIDCGESNPVVLEFDHVRGIKRDSVARMTVRGVSINTLLKEIEKCEVRCANCHRKETYRRGGFTSRG